MCCLGNHDHDARHKKIEVKEAEIHPEMITSTTSRKQNRRGDNIQTPPLQLSMSLTTLTGIKSKPE